MRIEYEQARRGYCRRGYEARRGETEYSTATAAVAKTAQRFAQVLEVPAAAKHVDFYSDYAKLPAKYQGALQRVR